MSTPLPQSVPQARLDHAEGARSRSMAATTGLVALVTLRALARRRGALALATLLPLTFYLVRLETHWTAIRLLSIGLGWATATLALFTQVSSRSVDRRLVVGGAPPATLLLGRYLAVLGLGSILGLLYSGLVLATIGDGSHPPERGTGHATADRYRRHSPGLPGRHPGSTGPRGGSSAAVSHGGAGAGGSFRGLDPRPAAVVDP